MDVPPLCPPYLCRPRAPLNPFSSSISRRPVIYTPRRLDMATLLCRLFVILMTAMCSHALHNESSVGMTENDLGWASLRRSWGRRGLVGGAGVAGCWSGYSGDGCTNMLTSSTTLSACQSYCNSKYSSSRFCCRLQQWVHARSAIVHTRLVLHQ